MWEFRNSGSIHSLWAARLVAQCHFIIAQGHWSSLSTCTSHLLLFSLFSVCESVLLTTCFIMSDECTALALHSINAFLSPCRRRTLWLCPKSQTTRARLVWITQPTSQRMRLSPPFQTARLYSLNPLKPRHQTPKRLTTAWARLTRCPG